jgi:hypothetical protein
MRNRTYGGVRGRKTKVGKKLLCFPPTRLLTGLLICKNGGGVSKNHFALLFKKACSFVCAIVWTQDF